MTLFRNKYRIESTRLRGWDYSWPAWYYVTIVTHNRRELFGHIVGGRMVLNEFGTIVKEEWEESFQIRRELVRDEFVVMPNHVHGIVRIVRVPGADKIIEFPETNDSPATVETHGRASLPDERNDEHDEPDDGSDQRDHSRNPMGIAYRTPKSISSFMAGFKSIATKRINEMRNTPRVQVWQPRFRDSIVRDAEGLYRIRQYMRENPCQWPADRNNPEAAIKEPSEQRDCSELTTEE